MADRFAALMVRSLLTRGLVFAAVSYVTAGCGASQPAQEAERAYAPSYNKMTGRLEQLTSDRNGDGKIDTWAYMDGTSLERVELDRDGDGVADRVEYYETRPPDGPAARSPIERATITRAEETGGPGKTIVRSEFYEKGALARVEEDTDGDGRVNKWERHAAGRLVELELDMQGRGFPDRRLIYARGGVERVEADPDGDGVFVPSPPGTAGQ
jgi:hypothetical protein